MLDTETFLFLCHKAEITLQEMEIMTIGNCLDFINVYIDYSNPNKQNKRTKKASQSDFDNF